MSILIGLFTLALVVISIFLVLLVLAQKSKSDGGVGGALGGGMTEATFGADSGNVLSRMTHYGAIAFFLISFGLYLAQIHKHSAASNKSVLPSIEAPAAPAVTIPATPAEPTATESAPAASIPATTAPAAATEPAAKP
jgi:preprotein translocase subunit SecG